jgi:TrmH family RNA methyltransferase
VSRPTPTSTRSEWARAVRRLANRSFREQVGRFLVEGPQSVREVVHWRPGSISEVVVSENANPVAIEVADRAGQAGIVVTRVPDQVLVSVCETVSPQGVAAICEFVDRPLPEVFRTGNPPGLAVLLHEVRDPGNAGTVLRTADAAGAEAVIFSERSVDPYNGKCVRSSAGSIFHTSVSRDSDTDRAIELAKSAGLQVLATDLAGDLILGQNDAAAVLRKPTMWLFGSEAHGLPTQFLEKSDCRVRVPIYGAAESLNLASAAAVCLYTSALEQRR